jgi:ketosteroid isomerase-like protein
MRRFSTMLGAALVVAACMRGAEDDTATQDAAARAEVIARLDGYTAAARAVDADASAAFFAPNGTLFEPGIPPIVTPDSIRAFIKSFPGVEVDSAIARADTVELHGRTAYVWGSYFERLRFPGQPESAQHGRFVMEWVRGEDAVWRILRYYRVPLPANWPPAPTAP